MITVDQTHEMVEAEPVVQRLVQLAGLRLEDIEHGRVRSNFIRAILSFIAINKGKERYYGDYVDGMKENPDLMVVMQVYFDMRRKWFRLDNMIRDIAENPSSHHITTDMLLEIFADIGTYSGMAIDTFVSREEPKPSLTVVKCVACEQGPYCPEHGITGK